MVALRGWVVSIYDGYQVVVVNPRPIPVKRHDKKPHMSEAYHLRIQKKWNKRWGEYDSNPLGYSLGNDGVVIDRENMVIYTAPACAEKIKRAIK